MGLLQPIWLFAMAGIIVPVVIHLWNNKQGRVLAIGSIEFLDKTSRRKARSRKISDWRLLILRCLLLILLSLLLAGPYWKHEPDEKKGWIMITNGVKDTRLLAMRDSLVDAGFEEHPVKGLSWWGGFSMLDEEAPAGLPFYIFTDGRLEHFYGERPVTSRQVNWYVSEPRDSTINWIEHAWARAGDSVIGLEGSSGPTGISFHFTGVDRQHAVIDTSIWRVGVYTDEKYIRDGQWIEDVVKSLEQFTRRNISVKRYKAGEMPGSNEDWLFWLSSKSLPDQVKASNILTYESGREMPLDSWIKNSNVKVEKVVEETGHGTPIWVEGFGRAVLSQEETKAGMRYHFYSHFDPAWNGLVWSPDFPVLMKELLWSGGMRYDNGPVQDRRVIDPSQAAPSRVSGGHSVASAQTSFSLSPLLWILIFLILVAERILSFKRSKDG